MEFNVSVVAVIGCYKNIMNKIANVDPHRYQQYKAIILQPTKIPMQGLKTLTSMQTLG